MKCQKFDGWCAYFWSDKCNWIYNAGDSECLGLYLTPLDQDFEYVKELCGKKELKASCDVCEMIIKDAFVEDINNQIGRSECAQQKEWCKRWLVYLKRRTYYAEDRGDDGGTVEGGVTEDKAGEVRERESEESGGEGEEGEFV
jgi:hypothetical protein